MATVASTLLDTLVAAGVRHVFGIPGDAINDLVDAIRPRDDIQFVHVRHEEDGAFAASAQAKLTGRLAACVGTAGPGAIHLLNGLYDAHKDHAPVLAVTGQVGRAHLGSHYHQEVDLAALFADVAVFSETIVSADQMPRLASQAVKEALTQRGVAHLALPADVAGKEVPDAPRIDVDVPLAVMQPDPEALDRAAGLLGRSGAPTILAGVGAAGAVEELLALADTIGAPIIKTLPAKDLFPDRHPLSVGGLGLLGTRAAVKAVERSDLMVLVGTDFPYEDFLPSGTDAIQIDIDAAVIGRRMPVAVGVVGQARPAIEGLASRLTRAEDRSHLEAARRDMDDWRAVLRQAEEDDAEPLRPQRVAAAVGRIAPPGAIFVCDTGAVTVWAARHIDIRDGQRFTLSSGLASMAFAVPGAVGAALAYPDRPVIALVGDGGFSMLLSGFLTAVDHGIDLTVVVFDNSKLGLIQMEQEAAGNPEFTTGLRNPDFAEVATALGGAGISVDGPAGLEPALEQALATGGPTVVSVAVDPDEVVVPPKLMPEFVLGYAAAKLREMAGQGDRGPGIEPLSDILPVVRDRTAALLD